MRSDRSIWKQRAQGIAAQLPPQPETVQPFLSLLEFVELNQWEGGCHALAAVLHVLFADSGLESTPVLGEAGIAPVAFDHSWVDVGGAVYDVAIVSPHDAQFALPPTFRGVDLATGSSPRIRYAISSGLAYGEAARAVQRLPFHAFMSVFPEHRDGLWGIAALIASRYGKTLDISTVRKKHIRTKWLILKSGGLTPARS